MLTCHIKLALERRKTCWCGCAAIWFARCLLCGMLVLVGDIASRWSRPSLQNKQFAAPCCAGFSVANRSENPRYGAAILRAQEPKRKGSNLPTLRSRILKRNNGAGCYLCEAIYAGIPSVVRPTCGQTSLCECGDEGAAAFF